jgi:flagellar assembly factor FliW
MPKPKLCAPSTLALAFSNRHRALIEIPKKNFAFLTQEMQLSKRLSFLVSNPFG